MQPLNAADDEGRDEEEEEERRQIIPAFIKLPIVSGPARFALEFYLSSAVIPHLTAFTYEPPRASSSDSRVQPSPRV